MKVDLRNEINKNCSIYDLYRILLLVKEDSIFYHQGLKVKIDTTFDFINNNVLVRWLDIEEGFNDRIILNSTAEFQTNFEIIND